MSCTRRDFLASTSAAACLFAVHEQLSWAGDLGRADSRITGLRLKTAAPLAEMKEFYRGRLGLPVRAESSQALTIGAGASTITFEAAKTGQGNPFYHFAFNIPENKIRSARDWQRERSELLPVTPQLRDSSYPEDVVHFRNWNAHSIFFFDPAQNVVEYIARHDLSNRSDGPFTKKDILYASEIAFIVDDVPAAAASIQEGFGLGSYRPGGKTFHAIGDEHGLLLVFQRGRNLSLADPTTKDADVFPTVATIRGSRPVHHRVPGFPYEIDGR